MKIRAALAAMATILTVLTGCSAEQASKATDTPAGTNADPTSSEEPTEEPDEGDGTLKFGDSASYDNGLSITVTEPQPFEPSRYAVSGKGRDHIRMTVTVVNKTGKPYDVALDYITMQSGNQEAEQIFDSAKGLEGTPTTKVLDGREAKYDVGFTVKNPADLVLEYQPGDWDLDSVIFTS